MAKFGEYALEGYLKAKQMKQEQEQFNQQMATQERMDGLLNMIEMNKARLEKRKLDWQMSQGNDRLYEVKEGTPLADVIGAGTHPIQAIDDMIGYQKALLDMKKPQGNRYQDLGKVVKDGATYQKLYDREKGEFVYEQAPEDKSSRPYPSPYESYQMFSQEREFQTTEKEKKEKLEKEKQTRIESNQLKLDSLISGVRGGEQEIADSKTGMKQKVYTVGNQPLPTKAWKPQANATVNVLLQDYDLKNTKDTLLNGVKKTIRNKGYNFDKLDKAKQRNALKQVLDTNKTIPSEKKKVLYQWIEVYTR
jgi:hypothetical protein